MHGQTPESASKVDRGVHCWILMGNVTEGTVLIPQVMPMLFTSVRQIKKLLEGTTIEKA